MKRLIRRTRRNLDRANKLFTDLLKNTRNKQGYSPAGAGVLAVEPLESRVLLTTLILEKGDTGQTVFSYSDPSENTESDVTVYNELRIGTLSGQGPEQDVIVEILGYDYYTESGQAETLDIYGNIEHSDGSIETVGGGPGGGNTFRLLEGHGPLDNHGTGYTVSALASDSSGNNYGLTDAGELIRYDMGADDVYTTLIGQIVDTNNPFQSNITFTDFYSADCAWGWVDYDTDGDGDYDTQVLKEVIYAVVGADLISDTGYVQSSGSVLITIDPLTGEAEPVAKVADRASYLASEIRNFGTNEETGEVINPNISSIIFSEENHNDSVNTDEPVFIAFNAATHRFLTISVDIAAFTGNTTVATRIITEPNTDDQDIVVSGFAYCDHDGDGDSSLFATTYSQAEDGSRTGGAISIIDFDQLGANFLGTHLIREVAALEQHADDDWDQEDRFFDGFTFDPVAQMGYASEGFTTEVYQVNLAGLQENDGTFTIDGHRDIYQMYIAQSTADTFITLTRYTLDNGVKVYTPTGGEPSYLFTDEDDSAIYTPGNAGGIAIGTHDYLVGDATSVTFDAVTFIIDPSETAPAPYNSYGGTWQNGEIRPGIVLEEGNDIGMISVGGSVFGDVDIRGGSVGTFYCGFLGTNQFVVNGDLQNLIVGTEAGGVNESDGVWQPALSEISYDYGLGEIADTSTAVLDVIGHMGSFYGVGDWGLPIRVWGYDIDQDGDLVADPFPGVFLLDGSDSYENELRDVGYADVYREMEVKNGNEDSINFQFGSFDHIITNDTAATAQVLGSTSSGKVSVVGSCESFTYDTIDYYAVGVMAGDDVTIRLYDTGGVLSFDTNIPGIPESEAVNAAGTVSVYAPDGELIAISGEINPLDGSYLPISFVADQAGLYNVVVSSGGAIYYRLDIEGLTETSLGGGNVLANLRSNYYAATRDLAETDSRSIVKVISGNIGAINVNGHAALPQIIAMDGDIKVVKVNGEEDQGLGYASIGVEISDTGLGVIGVESQISASGSIGEVRVAGMSTISVYAGDDIQSFYAAGDVAAGIYANDDIGSVYVGGNFEVGGATVDSVIMANADGNNDVGIIDSILVNGYSRAIVSTGRDTTGINGKTVSGAGNVRFVYVGYRGILGEAADIYYGDMVEEAIFDIGQTVEITDDSGARVLLSSGYKGVPELVEYEDGTSEMVNLDGGFMTIRIMPVYSILPDELLELPFTQWPAAGNAIVDVTSTDGLRVTTRSGSSVELGRVAVEGAVDDRVVFSGNAPISVYRLEVQAPVTEDTATDNTGTDTTIDNTSGTVGITNIINTSGWYLDQNGDVFTGNRYQRRTTWVGGDMLSIVVGDVDILAADGDTGVDDGTTSPDYTPGLTLDEQDALLELEYAVANIAIKGNLGYSEGVTGQLIVAPQVYAASTQDVTPGGDMTNGLYSQASINKLTVYGRMEGDVYIASSVNQILANADKSTFENQFDGVSASIVVRGNLNYINVGDGLIDPGTGQWADAGIFVLGNINTVIATGLDHDIAGAIISGGNINSVYILNGADLEGYNYVGDFNCPNIATHAFFSEFYIDHGYTGTGTDEGEYALGQLIVKGRDSEISGAYITVGNANRIIVTGGADGITHSYIGIGNTFSYMTTDTGTINTISVCGYGIKNSFISLGYNVKSIAVARGGDIRDTVIAADWNVGAISADNIVNTNIIGVNSNTNTIKRIVARKMISNMTVSAGTIGAVKAGTDLIGSTIFAAGKLTTVRAGGNIYSDIVVKGPYGFLGSVYAGGDIGGQGAGTIAVDGHIGVIVARGDFDCDLYLNEGSQYFAGSSYRGYELRAISAGGLMELSGEVYGDIGTIKSVGDFGVRGEEFNVNGSLRQLIVGGGRVESEMLLDLNVVGDLGIVRTTGDIEGDITVTGDLGKVIVSRPTKETDANHGINGDITVGGALKAVTIKNGDKNGSINATGDFLLRTIGCGLYGATVVTDDTAGLNLTGSIGGEGDDITSYVVTGDVRTIKLTGTYLADGTYEEGSIGEDAVILIDGDLGTLYVSDDIMGTIYVTGNIGRIYADSIVGASIIVGGNIGTITVKGSISEDEDGNQSVIVVGYDPGCGGEINPDDFAKIDRAGIPDDVTAADWWNYIDGGRNNDDYWTMADWSGEVWASDDWVQSEIGHYWTVAEIIDQDWAADFVDQLDINAEYAPDNLQAAITLAYTDYMQATVVEAYTDYLMDKYTIQGDAVDPAEVATSGNISRVTVGGTLRNSTIAAGVAPGSDGKFGDTAGTDKAGDGISKIGTVVLGTTPIGESTDDYGIFADGDIGKLIVSRNNWTIPVHINSTTGFRAWEVPDVEDFDLESEPGTMLLSFEAGDPLTYSYGDGTIFFRMSGPGQALVQVDTATGNIVAIQLKDTTARTSVRVGTRNLDHELEVGRIFTNDDSSLNLLQVDGTLVYSGSDDALKVGGNIRTLKLNSIDSTDGSAGDTMNVIVGGGVSSFMVASLNADSSTPLNIDINGDIVRAIVTSVSTDVYLSADSIRSLSVRGDFEGNVSSDAFISSIAVRGNYDGLIYSDGDISRVIIRGDMGAVRVTDRPEATIAAVGSIKAVLTGDMINASIVAGANVYTARVAGDMIGSDIVSGVILDEFSDLRDGELIVSEGDIYRVLVSGDFEESNIAAGVAPGADGFFSTSDDILNTKAVEKANAPTVEDIFVQTDGGGSAFNTIVVKFADVEQNESSNINVVSIRGEITTGDWNSYDYAFIAAGDIGKVVVHGRRYDGDDEINFKEVKYKTLDASKIDMALNDLDDVANSAIWVQVDGLDQRFSTSEAIFQGASDDSFVCGNGVTVSYDEEANSILFTVADGLLENIEGANYYKVTVRSDYITNVMGINLDGEYAGVMPAGNGVVGGNFVYTFAVADVGDLATTAFAPFDEEIGFPTNLYWDYTGILGDNRSYTGAIAMLDNDYFALNNLKEGQILAVSLADLDLSGGWYSVDTWYENVVIELLKMEEHEEFNGYSVTSVESGEFVRNADGEIISAPVVSSEMSELFWSNENFYGYDDESGSFFKIDVSSPDGSQGTTVTTFDELENDLFKINSTIRSEGIIESLTALSGHTGDSFWAIADFTPVSGETRQSLVLIENIERSVDVEQDEQLTVWISDADLNDYSYYYDSDKSLDIVGLAETTDYSGTYSENILYAVAQDGSMYQLNSDVDDADFGDIKRYFNEVTVDGTQYADYLTDTDGNSITEFNVTGMSLSREGDGLLILHDLTKGDYSSTVYDAIYKVTFNDDEEGQAQFWQDLRSYTTTNDGNAEDFDGIAASPDGYILVGIPMYGTPIGDSIDITYSNDTKSMVFGSSDSISLRGGLVTVTSDADLLPQNYESYSFVANNMYYAMTVEYNSSLQGDQVIEFDDIDFWRSAVVNGETQNILAGSTVARAYSDNPFVTVYVDQFVDDFDNVSSSLIVTIDAEYAGGEANIYFSADSGQVLTLNEFAFDKVDQIIGEDVRKNSDVLEEEHDLIMPDMSELTVSAVNLATAITLNADDALDYNLSKFLSRNLYNQLDGVISDEIRAQVVEELTLRGKDTILADFLDSLESTQYNALAYDSTQKLFALVNTDTFESRPIIVNIPRDSGNSNYGDSYLEGELTLDALSKIYNENNMTTSSVGTTSYTIDNIYGLEFGAVKTYTSLDDNADDDTTDGLVTDEKAELWAIVTITATTHKYGEGTETITSQNLMRIDDILDPSNNMEVASNWNLENLGYSGITELAYGTFPTADAFDQPVLSADKNELYGFDVDSNTLVRFDISKVVRETATSIVVNPEYGLPTAVGTVNSSYVISSMDFDSKGRLLAIENGADSIIQIDTDLSAGADRSKTIEDLPTGNYSVLTFNSTLVDSEPILIRTVSGSVDGNVNIKVDGTTGAYAIGDSTPTTVSGVSITSSDGSTLIDGFNSFNVSYTGDQGIVKVELDKINWSEYGDIDSVFLSNNSNAVILDYDDDSIVFQIDTTGADGSFTLYFGATVDVLRPGLGYTSARTVASSTEMFDNGIEIYTMIEEDADYVLRVGIDYTSFLTMFNIPTDPIKYNIEICAFNDGDSDFGQVDISEENPFVYDPDMPNDSAVDISSSSDEWVADTRKDDTYLLDRSSSAWSMAAMGSFITPGEAGSLTVVSELALLYDVDVYKLQLTEGQIMQVSIDSLKFTGGEDVEFMVGVYNSDLEAVATISTSTLDTDVISISSDPDYTVQAVHTIDGYDSVIDPMEEVNGIWTGTYYIVVSLDPGYTSSGLYDTNDFGDVNYYSLNVNTFEGTVEMVESPQLVYVSFSSDNTSSSDTNLSADFLLNAFDPTLGFYNDIVERPAFSLSDFDDLPHTFQDDLDGDGVANETVNVTWEYMVDEITKEIQRVYQEALDDPTTPDIREDQQLIYITNDPSEVYRREHTTIIIGGDYPLSGVLGVSSTVDRHNEDRSDICTVGSEEIGRFYNRFLDSDSDKENVERVITAVAGTAIHELGHTLGLEHSTEVNADLTYPVDSAAVYTPDNVMNYNPVAIDMSGAKFEERCMMASTENNFSYTINQPGFQNEIDSLLRNLATVPPVVPN